MRYRFRAAAVAAACLALGVGVTACGDDDDEGGAATSGGGAAATTTADSGGTALSQATVDTLLKFTGGTAGKADDSLEPVVFGYANQEGGAPSFKEYHGVTSAAVDVINNELGGIDGHPLKLEECIIQSEEDGQKCGAQFRDNDKISAGILGLAVVGNGSFFKTIDGRFPVVVDVAATGPDATTPKVYNLDGGGAGVLNAEAQAVKDAGAKTVALLTANNPSGKNTANTVQVPQMKKLGIEPKVVLFEDTATAPEMASTLTSAGAAKAGAISFNPSSNAQCNLLFDSLKSLNIKTPVITNVFCAADEVLEHIGDGMEGWRFSSFGWNPRVPGNEQSDAYVDVLKVAGKPELTNAGYTFKAFADVMALAKLATQVGVDNLSGDAMDKAITEWRGPGYMLEGELNCGANTATVSVCGTTGNNSVFEGGAFKNVATVEVPSS